MTIFNRCFDMMEKNAGFVQGLKDLALTEVAGTKPWVIGRAKPLTDSLKNTGKLVAGARPAAQSGTRTAVRGVGGARAYDVSDMAKKMGLV